MLGDVRGSRTVAPNGKILLVCSQHAGSDPEMAVRTVGVRLDTDGLLDERRLLALGQTVFAGEGVLI